MIVKDHGSILLTIQYSTEAKAIVLSVISAKNLQTNHPQGLCEAYVKWYAVMTLS